MNTEIVYTFIEGAALIILALAWKHVNRSKNKKEWLSWSLGCSFWWAFFLSKRIGWPIVLLVFAAYFIFNKLNEYDRRHGRQNKRVVN